MERTHSSISSVVRSSVYCNACGETLEAQDDDDRKMCSCGRSWVIGNWALKGHNTSIVRDYGGQLRWEF